MVARSCPRPELRDDRAHRGVQREVTALDELQDDGRRRHRFGDRSQVEHRVRLHRSVLRRDHPLTHGKVAEGLISLTDQRHCAGRARFGDGALDRRPHRSAEFSSFARLHCDYALPGTVVR